MRAARSTSSGAQGVLGGMRAASASLGGVRVEDDDECVIEVSAQIQSLARARTEAAPVGSPTKMSMRAPVLSSTKQLPTVRRLSSRGSLSHLPYMDNLHPEHTWLARPRPHPRPRSLAHRPRQTRSPRQRSRLLPSRSRKLTEGTQRAAPASRPRDPPGEARCGRLVGLSREHAAQCPSALKLWVSKRSTA